jgi:DNA-binding transcriptional LysR family regulator
MNIPWEDVHLLLAVADSGSFSAAARKLRVAQPTISRRLADVEARLGEPLFVRRIDGVGLTSFGERLMAPARNMAEWANELGRAIEARETKPQGVVRLTAPPGVAFDFVAPFAVWLRSRLPGVTLEVVSTIQYLDLVRRDADLALRMQRPTQRDLVVLASHEEDVGVFAARSYIDRRPRGFGVADIDWIGWAPPRDHLSPNPELAAVIPGFRPVFASDDFLVQLAAAEAGIGAIFLGRNRNRSRLASPSALEEIPLDLGRRFRGEVHLVAARAALLIPRVKAVAELLAHELVRLRKGASERQKKVKA